MIKIKVSLKVLITEVHMGMDTDMEMHLRKISTSMVTHMERRRKEKRNMIMQQIIWLVSSISNILIKLDHLKVFLIQYAAFGRKVRKKFYLKRKKFIEMV